MLFYSVRGGGLRLCRRGFNRRLNLCYFIQSAEADFVCVGAVSTAVLILPDFVCVGAVSTVRLNLINGLNRIRISEILF